MTRVSRDIAGPGANALSISGDAKYAILETATTGDLAFNGFTATKALGVATTTEALTNLGILRSAD